MKVTPEEPHPIHIPLPPLDEQRRIARVLDGLSSVRAARERCLVLLGELRHTLLAEFLRHHGSQIVPVRDVLASPLGNGISPATAGTHVGAVLTLTALRDGVFDARAQKACVFAKPPAARQMVTRGTLLVSRGNGNLKLVGRGAVVRQSAHGVAFPDTMIGAEVDFDLVTPEFLEAVWSTSAVRDQLERSATTTNGTFKINQAKLSRVAIPLPSLEGQERFSRELRPIATHQSRGLAQLAQLDELFGALSA